MPYSFHTNAPGKAILLGEHSVVYNRFALCGVIDSCRIHCWINPIPSKVISITTKSIYHSDSFTVSLPIQKFKPIQSTLFQDNVIHYNSLLSILSPEIQLNPISKSIAAIVLFFYSILSTQFGRDIGFHIVVDNQGIPEEKGLGGSAALCTSVASCMLLLFHNDPNRIHNESFLKEVNSLSYKGEVLFHGKPSGLDNTVSCYGGLLKFKKEVDGQFSMHPVHSSPISLLLIDSGLPKNTASMIQKVATLHSVFPDAVDRLFDSIQSLVLSLVDQNDSLIQNLLPQAIEVNQGILKTLDVSCSEIDTIVSVTSRYHYSAKLTGGGGGGFVIAMARDPNNVDEAHLIGELQNMGYMVHKVCVGGEGVQMMCEEV